MRENTGYSVLIVDDHPLFRKGAAQLIALDDRFKLVDEATGGDDGLALALQLMPDLILLDMNMKDIDGIQTLKAMREAGVKSKIIMLTVSNSEKNLVAAMRNGADGYLLKDMEPEDILNKLEATFAGQPAFSDEMSVLLINTLRNDTPTQSLSDASLTEREDEILALIARGRNNKTIARELGISDGTVKVHVKNLLRKLNLSSRLEAAIWAIDNNIKR
ncbi:MAG: two-component system nitrate/nitrite response regulator NarL [Gammaproteobacteria bacterium]|jgi:two-component system nitrate/nitrite response regulator NarL